MILNFDFICRSSKTLIRFTAVLYFAMIKINSSVHLSVIVLTDCFTRTNDWATSLKLTYRKNELEKEKGIGHRYFLSWLCNLFVQYVSDIPSYRLKKRKTIKTVLRLNKSFKIRGFSLDATALNGLKEMEEPIIFVEKDLDNHPRWKLEM